MDFLFDFNSINPLCWFGIAPGIDQDGVCFKYEWDFKSKISDLTNKILDVENNNNYLKQEIENNSRHNDKFSKENELKISKMNSKINEYVSLNTDLYKNLEDQEKR